MKKKAVNLDDFDEVASARDLGPREVVTDPSQIKPEPAASKPIDLGDFEEVSASGKPVSSTPFPGVPIIEAPKHEPNRLEAGLGGFFGGFLDEATGLARAMSPEHRGKSLSETIDIYRAERNKERRDIEASMAAHPGAALVGGLASAAAIPAGTAARAATTGAKIVQGAKAGATFGGAVGLGSSEADITRGEVGKAAEDVVGGTAAGAVVGAGLSAAGQAVKAGVRALAPGAARRLEEMAFTQMGRTSTESERRALEAAKPDVLAEMRAAPELRTATRTPKEQARLAGEAKSGVEKQASEVLAAADNAVGGQKIEASLARLEARQAELAANPATAGEAEKIGRFITRVREQYAAPVETILDTPGIVSGLAKGAGKKAKERLAIRASDVGEVINAYGLKTHAKDPIAFADATNKAVSQVGKRIGEVYEAVDAAGGQIPLSEAMRAMDKVVSEYSKNPASKNLAKSLEGLIENVRDEWGKFPAHKSVPMVPTTVFHDFVSTAGRQWQPSGVIDQTIAAEMRRKVWGAMKDVLDGHVAEVADRNPSIKKIGDLVELNREYAALKIVQKLAEPKAFAAKLAPATATAPVAATKTGVIPQERLREMAEALPPRSPARTPLQETVAEAAERSAPGTGRKVEELGRRKAALEAIESSATTRGQREPFVGTSRFSELMTEAGDKGRTLLSFPYRAIKAGAKLAREKFDETVAASGERQAAQRGAASSNDIAISTFAKKVRSRGELSDDQLMEEATRLGVNSDTARKVIGIFAGRGRKGETATRAAAAQAGERR